MQTDLRWSEGGVAYRDLNKNGRMDPYEDARRTVEERVEDLLGRMTLEEKAGLLFHAMAPPPGGGFPGLTPTAELVTAKHLSHFNVAGRAAVPARQLAEWQNELQRLAEETRLGVPVTLSTDPRHGFSHNPGASFAAGSFSQWPEPPGLAAIGDPELVERFADAARQEYLAVGIRVALHPMADLATEPRWGRIIGTFGEDAELAAKMVAAYIRGFQGATLGPHSVACMVKHFPGGGPQKDGEDPHFPYGKEQVYPGGKFEYHLIPFEAAFAAGAAQVMPYYGVPIGVGFEEVAFAFDKAVITGLLRGRYGFDGVVCTDWQLLVDRQIGGGLMEARAWGVEQLDTAGRTQKIIEAGCDQFGGEQCPEVVVELVRSRRVSEARIDASARRLLRDKFRLGLFDDPYVDPSKADAAVGANKDLARRTSQESIVLLKNDRLLPFVGRPRLFLENVEPAVASGYAEVVATPDEADAALLRLQTPYEPREGFLQQFIHAGTLAFAEAEQARVVSIARRVPTAVALYLDRAAVVTAIAEAAPALLAEFGASDAALLDVLFGRVRPEGKLPFELPSSMAAVERQHPDAPYDSENPLFRFGDGLSY